jgi:nicotinate-nucleotide adenylyltransferase
MMHRIGIMGGMFDPVHTGHMQLARTALQVLKLDRLHLVPCAAVDSDERLVVDDREYQREGVSYAVDTLKSFATEFPGATLVYVQGWDSFNSLPTWHRWQELFLFCHICAVSRPGQMLPTENSPPGSTAAMLYDELRCRQVESVDALFASDHGRILVLRDVALDVSSSEVREALSKGGDAQNVCTGVEQYIKQHQLYRI